MRLGKSFFLFFRKWNPLFITAGVALAPLRIDSFEVLIIGFTMFGLYLTLFHRRSAHVFNNPFYVAAILYGIWVFGLSLWRGQIGIDEREYRYALLMTAVAFCGPGFILVRDPLRVFVIAARLAMILSLGVFMLWLIIAIRRLGMGNAAPFSFIIAVLSIAAAIRLRDAPRYLPNSPIWMVIGMAPLAASETRAVLPIMLLACLIEIILDAQRLRLAWRIGGYLAAALAITVIMSSGILQSGVMKRFDSLYETFTTRSVGETSLNIRLEMWRTAGSIIQEHPLVGIGAEKMKALSIAAPQYAKVFAKFQHTHNFLIDEALATGVVGLLLLLAFVGGMIVYVYRYNPDNSVRRNIFYFTAVLVAYGLFHNPFLHEATIIMIFGYLGILNAQASKNRLGAARLRANV